MTDPNNKYMFEKTDKTIDNYIKKQIILADLLKIIDSKTHVCLIDRETEEVLYNDRAEYIIWTTEGCACSLCDKPVVCVDSIVDKDTYACIEIQLNMKKAEKAESGTTTRTMQLLDLYNSEKVSLYTFLRKFIANSDNDLKCEIDLLKPTKPFTHLYTEIFDNHDDLDLPRSEKAKRLDEYLEETVIRFWITTKYMKFDYDETLREVVSVAIVLNV